MTLPPVPPALPAIDAYELLDLPVALADAQGRLLAANTAFIDYTGHPLAALQGRWLDDLLCGPATDPVLRLWLAQRLRAPQGFGPLTFHGQDARGQPLRAHLALRTVGTPVTGCVLSLQPERAAQDHARLRELMEMAQHFGRIGVWERDLHSGEGLWDQHVWRIWGLQPQPDAPPFDQAIRSVLADDQVRLREAFAASARSGGTHSVRFRVLAGDGQVHHLRSQWHTHTDEQGRPRRALGILTDDTETFRLAQSYGEAHAQLRLAVELADIMVWRYEGRRQRLFSDPRGWAMLRLPAQPEGMALQALAERVDPQDRTELQARLDAAGADDGPLELTIRFQRGDGEWRYLLARCVAQRDEQGELLGYLGVTLDLSERFAQTQREKELARRLEMATGAAGVAIWTQHIDSGEMHWDEQMRRLHGGPDAVVAQDIDDYRQRYLHPDDRAAAREAIRTLLARKSGLVDLDLRIVRADGTMRRVASRTSIEAGPRGGMLYGVMLDVTERHAAEHRLREAAERMALVTRSAGIGTWDLAPGARHSHWDEQMFVLRGRQHTDEPDDLADRAAWVHPEDMPAARAELRQAIAEDRASNAVFRVVWPDGSVHWLASRSVPVKDERGHTVRRIGINWDVTDAHAAAEAQQAQLLAQRESQAKSQFLARMSHELRTPLNAVLGFAQLLLADGSAQDEALRRRRVEHIHAAGEHLLSLINDVLDLSSLESGELPLQLAPVALPAVVQSVLPLVENMAGQQNVELRTGDLGHAVMADAMRLRQALINLVANAIKYNRPGGHVLIDAEREGDGIRLCVHDNGRGMTAQQLQQVFQPFNRLGAEREGIDGTGIGLAIVQATVQRMGGSVAVRSVAGIGSCFEIRLAAADIEVEKGPPSAHAPLAPSAERAPRRMLYIEDNPVNVMIVSELVSRRRDLQLDAAADGRSGIAAACDTAPELILIDMQLPDFDGHEVLRRLRADPRTAAIRCIAVSANAMPEDIRHALANGFDDYWTKPLDFRRFMTALDEMFGPAP